ncbi:MAG TPA: hypothetical protein VMI31_02580, partial [Fimbriimonadaceae bacterium]|nr:hypothetical protein [Fimbriimonadaceae bacterium]
MRFLLAFLFLFGVAAGQSPPGVWDSVFHFALDSADAASGRSVFDVAKPDIIVQVKKHELSGADLFEVTAVKPDYPADLLRAQVQKMCALIGVPARGLLVGTSQIEAGLSPTRATFATNGVIERDKGILRIAPIIQAFAGAPEPYTVHGITILFNGETPMAHVLESYNTPDVRLAAVALQNPSVVEYRVQLISQDPEALNVPDQGQSLEQKPAKTAS